MNHRSGPTFGPRDAVSLWLHTVRVGLEYLLVCDSGFNSQGWSHNFCHDRVCVCFDINFSDRKEGLMMFYIICDGDRWCSLDNWCVNNTEAQASLKFDRWRHRLC